MQFREIVIILSLVYLVVSFGEAKGEKNPLIVALGDSLTAGYGVEESFSFPGRLQRRLQEKGFSHRVMNAGVNGDTTAGGLRRIPWLLNQQPVVVILVLGANDGLRGLPVAEVQKNLETIIKACLKQGAKVLLAGIRIPPNYGAKYTKEFEGIYPHLARKYDVTFVPFFLEGVAGIKELNQRDGIHPTKEGYGIIINTLWRALESML